MKQEETQPSWTPSLKAISEWTPQTTEGDVNADGKFNIADLVSLRQWILKVPDIELKNWKAADLYSDNRLDSFDVVLMRRALIKNIVQ